ncbi:family 43 glycosylhydrolase [Mucilaginibacter sp. PAMB04274]|uniref:family 43 glycosylhydrolase n=1 Tax=Mucilaginibacter sp. PAMB04274 TaxID=3138568 RepID=UPI0031F6640D
MKINRHLILAFALLLIACNSFAQKLGKYNAIYSGIPWFDNNGKVVSAHGANMVKDHGKFYLFGEAHSDTSNAFAGFNCYSSDNLYNWKFERIALPVQDSGKLGPGRVGERPKVLRCPKTGEYIMLMHTDNLAYKDPCVGYATAKSITGPYKFQGPLLFNGEPVRKWDMGTFNDSDGTGYLIIHSGLLFKLADDYKSITEKVVDNKWRGHESPAIFKKGGIYFWLASDLTSWERNDNFYYTATTLKGPWIARGNFAPKGTLTWNSQTTFVMPITGANDTTIMFMGDRWSYPHQASSATYVWQPIIVNGSTASISQYMEGWQINTSAAVVRIIDARNKGINRVNKTGIQYKGNWQHTLSDTVLISRSDQKGDSFSVQYNGTQIGFYGQAGPDGGYARVILFDNKGKAMLHAMIDTYSKYPVTGLRFLSPVLPKGLYTLTVSVLGEHGSWSDKQRSDYGSKGNFVSLEKITVKD